MPSVRLAALLLASALTLPPAADWRTFSLETFPNDARVQIGAARDAALQRPTDASMVGELGLVLHAWEQFDLAAQAYADARRLAPGDVTWWALSGRLAARMGRHDLAAEYFGKAVALEPSPLLVLRHADALLDSGDLDGARRVYDLAVTMPAAEPAARYGRGRLAVASGDNDAARAEFERAITLTPTFGAAHYALALLQRKAGDLTGARASIARQQQCLACWPMPPDPWTARVSSVRTDAAALIQRGVAAAGGDDARAIALHEEAIASKTALPQAHVNLITLYARTGNLAKAEEHYKTVIASGTQLVEAHRVFGLALLAGRDTTRAEPVLLLAVEGNPQDAEALNALGLIQESSGRLAEAERSYRLTVAARPGQRAFRFNLARVLLNLGRLDEALAQLDLIVSPDDAESVRYVHAAGAVHIRKGDIEGGRRLSEEALDRAKRYGLTDLTAIIERDLAKLK